MTIEKDVTSVEVDPGRQLLSAGQAFMCAFDQGNDDFGAFGPRNLVTAGWRVRGAVDPVTLQAALDDVAARHDALRTVIVRQDGEPYGRVHPPGPVVLTVTDLAAPSDEAGRERRAHEFLNEVERTTRIEVTRTPLLCAALGRLGDDDAVLVLVTHHAVSDGWSMRVVLRDLAVRYADRRGFTAPALPQTRQYGEHAQWQQRQLEGPAADTARAYWRTRLAGARLVTVPTDRVRRPGERPAYAVHRFAFDERLLAATTALARSTRSSSFMVLYACYLWFLHGRTGEQDILATTLVSGRSEPGFHETVGAFFNLVPIRVDVAGCATFRDLLTRTRTAVFEAITYDLPFREVLAQAPPDLMAPYGDPHGAVTTFEVNQQASAAAEDTVGDLRYAALRRRLLSDDDTSEIPSGCLWDFVLGPAGEMVGVVKFNRLDFDGASIEAMVAEYRELLRASVASPDAALPRPIP